MLFSVLQANIKTWIWPWNLQFIRFETSCVWYWLLCVACYLLFFKNRDSLKHIYQLIKSMNGSAVNNIVYVSLIVFSNRSSCKYRWGSLFVACNKDLSLCDYYHNSLSAGQTFGTGLGVWSYSTHNFLSHSPNNQYLGGLAHWFIAK